MKLLNAAQIRQWDQYTIHHEPVSSLHLMERAATKCTDWLIAHQRTQSTPVKIFCGKGNNGGDGLAIARQLTQKNIRCEVYIAESDTKASADFTANLERLRQVSNNIHTVRAVHDLPVISQIDVVIDALFGSGLNRPLQDLPAAIVSHLNVSGAAITSIDIPSGMFADRSSKENTVVKATHTLSFQIPKLCFLVAENSQYFGTVEIFDIGLDENFISSVESAFHLTTLANAKSVYQPRNTFAHKGNFGHALIIGGASGKTGAAIIATELCLRAGAGLTSAHLLSGDYTALNTRCPEAMTLAGDELVKKNLGRFSAVAAGPGLGTDDIAHHIISLLLESYQGAMVLDADALNILSQDTSLIGQLPAGTILTPHPKEFDRLFGEQPDDFARIETALKQSNELNCIIVLKGHYTLVAINGEGFFNTTGNAGLAKGGSGDALTGIIASLLAQGYLPAHAAKLGVYLHGLAADIALASQSYETLLASDIAVNLPTAFKKLSNVS